MSLALSRKGPGFGIDPFHHRPGSKSRPVAARSVDFSIPGHDEHGRGAERTTPWRSPECRQAQRPCAGPAPRCSRPAHAPGSRRPAASAPAPRAGPRSIATPLAMPIKQSPMKTRCDLVQVRSSTCRVLIQHSDPPDQCPPRGRNALAGQHGDRPSCLKARRKGPRGSATAPPRTGRPARRPPAPAATGAARPSRHQRVIGVEHHGGRAISPTA